MLLEDLDTGASDWTASSVFRYIHAAIRSGLADKMLKRLGLDDDEIINYTLAYWDTVDKQAQVDALEMKRKIESETAKAKVRGK